MVAALQHPDPAVQEANAFSAAQLGLEQNSTVPDPVNITIECFASYCDLIGGCNRCDRSMLEGLHGTNRSAVLSDCYKDLCNAQQGTLDSDMGGIGVLRSSQHYTITFRTHCAGIHLVHPSTWNLFPGSVADAMYVDFGRLHKSTALLELEEASTGAYRRFR